MARLLTLSETVPGQPEATGAGKSCGKCREFLKYLVRDILEEKESG